MGWERIRTPRDHAVGYAVYWEDARRMLAGLPGGGLNIGFEAVDRHAAGELADKVALRCLSRGEVTELTYRELLRRTSRFMHDDERYAECFAGDLRLVELLSVRGGLPRLVRAELTFSLVGP